MDRGTAWSWVSPRRLLEIVGTSSPVSSFAQQDGDPVHVHDLERHVHDRAEQAVEVELAGELLGDLEQQGQLLGLALLAGGGRHPELPTAGGPSRLVMPARHPPLTIELADDVSPGGLARLRGAPARRQRASRPCEPEGDLTEGDRVVDG